MPSRIPFRSFGADRADVDSTHEAHRPLGQRLSASILMAVAVGVHPVADPCPGAPAVSFPFVVEDARVYVPVQVGSDSTRWFILDTGAGGSALDAHVASLLRVAVADTTSVGGAGRNQSWQAHAKGVSLSVGGVTIAPPSINVSPLDSLLAPSSGRNAPGIIGAEFFRDRVVDVDFGRHLISVYDPTAYRYCGNGTIIPLTFYQGLPMVDGSLTVAHGERLPMHVLVDLGAKSTLLIGEAFATKTQLLTRVPAGFRSPLGAGIGGKTWYDWVRISNLDVGPSAQTSIGDFVAGVSANGTLRGTWTDALLGVGFLQQYHVIFDYARNRMILERLEHVDPLVASSEADMSGMFLLRPAGPRGPVVVDYVVAGSPAEQAGIRPGDTLDAIGGRVVSRLSLGTIRILLRAGDGRDIPVGVMRGGQEEVKHFKLRRMA